MSVNIEARDKLALQGCRQIGKILRDNFSKSFRVMSKGDRDLVTDIDQRCEQAITSLIKKRYPQDGIVSEESPASASDSGFRWIIDPLDGTHNFIHNIEVFGTSVALEFKREVVLGLIYMPLTDELYSARKGEGAYRNGRKITVSDRGLREATLIYDSSLRLNKQKMLQGLDRLVDQVFNVRMFGSTVRSLSYIAEGKADIEVEFNDKPWDFAAGLLLVEEAGGRCSDFQSRPWNIDTKGYIASNAILHQQLLTMMRGDG